LAGLDDRAAGIRGFSSTYCVHHESVQADGLRAIHMTVPLIAAWFASEKDKKVAAQVLER
jgi:hypothetical protein